MPIVIDASLPAKWVVRDEASDGANAVLKTVSRQDAVVPAIFPFEIENILVVAKRRRRIDDAALNEALRLLKKVDITVQPFGLSGFGRHIDLAKRYALTAYDAAYVTLASNRKLMLFTADQRMEAAAQDLAVSVVLVN
ncbi:MAG: type II toxin-antitoxin system VapC family toxin [Candidatus Dormibacteria bacterium]